MDDWWSEFDVDVLRCVSGSGPISPPEVGKRLGISEDAAVSVLAMLAREGKIRIRLVEAV